MMVSIMILSLKGFPSLPTFPSYTRVKQPFNLSWVLSLIEHAWRDRPTPGQTDVSATFYLFAEAVVGKIELVADLMFSKWNS